MHISKSRKDVSSLCSKVVWGPIKIVEKRFEIIVPSACLDINGNIAKEVADRIKPDMSIDDAIALNKMGVEVTTH